MVFYFKHSVFVVFLRGCVNKVFVKQHFYVFYIKRAVFVLNMPLNEKHQNGFISVPERCF